MGNGKLFLGILLGFIMTIAIYPYIVDYIPTHLKTKSATTQTLDEVSDEYEVTPKVSGERRVTIKGNYSDEVNYKIVVRFRKPSIDDPSGPNDYALRDNHISAEEKVFIDMVAFLTSTSRGLSYAEYGSGFKERSVEYIKLTLEASGIEEIGIYYTLTD
jgi:hypothetical protein